MVAMRAHKGRGYNYYTGSFSSFEAQTTRTIVNTAHTRVCLQYFLLKK